MQRLGHALDLCIAFDSVLAGRSLKDVLSVPTYIATVDKRHQEKKAKNWYDREIELSYYSPFNDRIYDNIIGRCRAQFGPLVQRWLSSRHGG